MPIFQEPKSTRELVQRYHTTANAQEKHLLYFIADTVIDTFKHKVDNGDMNSYKARELVTLFEINEVHFQQRIIEILLKALVKNGARHIELWQALQEVMQQYSTSESFAAFMENNITAIFDQLIDDFKNYYYPSLTSRNLRYAHFLIHLLETQNIALHLDGNLEDTPHYQELLKLTKDVDKEISYQASIILQGLFQLLFLNSSVSNAFSKQVEVVAALNLKKEGKTERLKIETHIHSSLSRESKLALAQKVIHADIGFKSLIPIFPELDSIKNRRAKKDFKAKTKLEFHYDTCFLIFRSLPYMIDFISEVEKLKVTSTSNSSLEEQLFLLDAIQYYISFKPQTNYFNLLKHIACSEAFLPLTRFRAMLILFNPEYAAQTNQPLSELTTLFQSVKVGPSKTEQLIAHVFFTLQDKAISSDFFHEIRTQLPDKQLQKLIKDIFIFLAKYPCPEINQAVGFLENKISFTFDKGLSLKNLAKYTYPEKLPKELNNELMQAALLDRICRHHIDQYNKTESEISYSESHSFFREATPAPNKEPNLKLEKPVGFYHSC